MSDTVYNVQAREKGSKQHKLLGNERLTSKRVHALQFSERDKAVDAAQWLLDNNRDALDSVRVINAETRSVEMVATA